MPSATFMQQKEKELLVAEALSNMHWRFFVYELPVIRACA
jgi:hypothetical protein